MQREDRPKPVSSLAAAFCFASRVPILLILVGSAEKTTHFGLSGMAHFVQGTLITIFDEVFMITVVSGLPRSGTSLMMQMIVAGGIPALTDGLRSADENNLKGYLEWESAKALPQSPTAIAAAEGKVVKVISALLRSLPGPFEYQVIFMCRPLEEVITSQNRMLERLGREVAPAPQASVVTAFTNHLKEVKKWLAEQPNMSVLYVDYPAVVQQPAVESGRISEFLGQPLNVEFMTAQVEKSLYRERSGAMAGKS